MTCRISAAPIVLAACLVALAAPASTRADVVAYTRMGTFTTASPLTVGGVTATSASGSTLNIDDLNGLGVVGGTSPVANLIIDSSESVLFRFNAGPAIAVSFTTLASDFNGSATENLEGFGVGGQSLGSVSFSTTLASVNVSSRFGGVALSGFRIYGTGSRNGVSVGQINFTPNAVPEPASMAMLGVGLASAALAARARRRAA